MTAKKSLRAAVRAKRKALLPRQRDAFSKAIAAHILASSVWQGAEHVALYLALPEEVQTTLLWEKALAEGKTVFLPKVVGEGQMQFFRATKDMAFRKSAFGILEPDGSTQPLSSSLKSLQDLLCIVPGLAFDRQGARLGFGGGYYDRFLPYVGHSLGVCFACQILPSVPREPWDIPVQMLCTEDGLYFC